MPRRVVLLLLIAIAIGGGPATAIAHPRLAGTSTPDIVGPAGRLEQLTAAAGVPAASGMVAPVIAGLVLVSLLALRQGHGRRVLFMALTLALGVTAFETAVHSVHHLGDARAAEHCQAAASAVHTHGVDVQPPLFPGVVTQLVGAAPIAPVPCCGSIALAPALGRAPPA